MKELNAKAIEAVIRWHTAKDAESRNIESLESYLPSRTAGGKYIIKFGYGFDKARHPIMGKQIRFSTFEKWVKALEYCEQFLIEKESSATDDGLLDDSLI